MAVRGWIVDVAVGSLWIVVGSRMVRGWFAGGSRVVRWWFLGGSWVLLLVRDGSLLVLCWFVVSSLAAGSWVLRICCCWLATVRCWFDID